jgi:hypothetical protein
MHWAEVGVGILGPKKICVFLIANVPRILAIRHASESKLLLILRANDIIYREMEK